MFTRLDFLRGSLALAAVGAANPLRIHSPSSTALDRYISRPTPEYGFNIVNTVDNERYRTTVVSMTSQKWRSEREVDKPLWRHWLTITEPKRYKTRIGMLVISGGSNTDDPPRKIDPIIGTLAARTGAVIAELHQVPNQPLTFFDDGSPRSEDDLVAYTWDKYLRSGDDTWPLRLPMTKAAVRAMDTVTALTARSGQGPVVDRFVVGGTSKRGWTSWLTAAADHRVIAVVPVVIDVLNVARSAEHEYRVYGSWPPSLESYVKLGIMNWLGTPQLQALLEIEDPYSYRDRLVHPKLIVNASGDQFFTPDSSQFYFSGLVGEKYLRYIPNTDHSLDGATVNAAHTGLAFVDSIIAGSPRPQYDWHWDGDAVRVRSSAQPLSVKLWQAHNPRARDFRLQTIGPAFRSTELIDQGGNTFVARVAPPAHGFTAGFVELTYATLREDVFTVTTDVRVTPDVLPYGPPRLSSITHSSPS